MAMPGELRVDLGELDYIKNEIFNVIDNPPGRGIIGEIMPLLQGLGDFPQGIDSHVERTYADAMREFKISHDKFRNYVISVFDTFRNLRVYLQSADGETAEELRKAIPGFPADPKIAENEFHPAALAAMPDRFPLDITRSGYAPDAAEWESLKSRVDAIEDFHGYQSVDFRRRKQNSDDVQRFVDSVVASAEVLCVWHEVLEISDGYSEHVPELRHGEVGDWRWIRGLPFRMLERARDACRLVAEQTAEGSPLFLASVYLVRRAEKAWMSPSGKLESLTGIAVKSSCEKIRDGVRDLHARCGELERILGEFLIVANNIIMRLADSISGTEFFREGPESLLGSDLQEAHLDVLGLKELVSRPYAFTGGQSIGRVRMSSFRAALDARVQRELSSHPQGITHVALTVHELSLAGSPACRPDDFGSSSAAEIIPRLQRFDNAYSRAVGLAGEDGFRGQLQQAGADLRAAIGQLAAGLASFRASSTYFTHPPLLG